MLIRVLLSSSTSSIVSAVMVLIVLVPAGVLRGVRPRLLGRRLRLLVVVHLVLEKLSTRQVISFEYGLALPQSFRR